MPAIGRCYTAESVMRLRIPILVTCMFLVIASCATGALAGDTAAADHGADKPALLQWDFGSAFWSIIVFVILLVILRATAWKPILQGLQQRERFIVDSLEKARVERERSERLLAEYNDKLNKAREEATAIVEEGRRDAEEVRKRVHAEAKGEADAIVARAKRDIQIARDDAIKQLHDQSILLATSIATKMVRKELTAGDHQRLLDESLAELSEMNN